MKPDSPAHFYLPRLGLQLWTVRQQMEQDAPATLRAVKAAGYAQVELMRLVDAGDLTARARDLGLGVSSAFIDGALLTSADTASAVALYSSVEHARELKLRYLVFGYIAKGQRETRAQLQAHAARANAFGARCRDAGLQLCYHHHSFEFAPLDDGRTTGWEILTRDFDPGLVQFELDTFWLAVGGLDPVRTLTDLRGRVAQVHLKDRARGTAREWDEGAVPPEAFKELGRGDLPLAEILGTCRATGVDQCHVEQDQSPDPLASLVTSIGYLRTG